MGRDGCQIIWTRGIMITTTGCWAWWASLICCTIWSAVGSMEMRKREWNRVGFGMIRKPLKRRPPSILDLEYGLKFLWSKLTHWYSTCSPTEIWSPISLMVFWKGRNFYYKWASLWRHFYRGRFWFLPLLYKEIERKS